MAFAIRRKPFVEIIFEIIVETNFFGRSSTSAITTAPARLGERERVSFKSGSHRIQII